MTAPSNSPPLAAAYLNRGTLHCRERRYLEAASDLEQALQQGAVPCIVYYNWALVNLAQADVPRARSRLEEALRPTPGIKSPGPFSIASRAGDRFYLPVRTAAPVGHLTPPRREQIALSGRLPPTPIEPSTDASRLRPRRSLPP